MTGAVSSWRSPPGYVALGDGDTHVWRADLGDAAPPTPELESILAVDERDRAARFAFRADRERYIVSRAQLRTLLGFYLGRPPATLHFAYGAYGKPALDEPGITGLSFTVTHRRDLALYAIARRWNIGLDVEYIDTEVAYEAIARRLLSHEEHRQLQLVAAPERRQAFFRCWSRKEAYVKALGSGLSVALDTFDVSVDPSMPAALLRAAGAAGDSGAWTLYDLDPRPEYVAALAVNAHRVNVTLFDWPGWEAR